MGGEVFYEGLLPGELGLLTIAERKGAVRVPRSQADRLDVTVVERAALIERLVQRGLLSECECEGPVEERAFQISEEGRRVLSEMDRPAKS